MPATTDDTSLRITILVDNHARDGLVAEHGLSLWIEVDGRCILFDTGQGSALQPNARALGVDLGRTEVLVLSHGHYDHSGGVGQVLECAPNVSVYCHPAAVQPRFSIREGKAKLIGMPDDARAAIDTLPSQRLHWVSRPVMLWETLGITGAVPRRTDFEDTGGPFYVDPEGRRADPIEDDLALWIRTRNGLVICTGCSHAGLVNTLQLVRNLAGDGVSIRAVIGGFHLPGAGRPRLERTVLELRACDPELVVPCHCTGEPAAAFIADALGSCVEPGSAGMVFQF